jgi:hypothetical protein
MSEAEFQDWLTFSAIEPFGEERADLQAAIIACTIANAFRGKKQKPFKPADFMPKFDPPQPQSTEEMKMALLGIGG